MPRGIKGPKGSPRELQELREYAESLAPQRGMFSTLDQLIQQAPFAQAPAVQWKNYLQPGRMLRRDEAQFPLKKEELEYALHELPEWVESQGDAIIQRDALLKYLRQSRPRFSLDVSRLESGVEDTRELLERLSDSRLPPGQRRIRGFPSTYGPEADPRLSHQSPGSTYEESVTRYNPQRGAFEFRSHFTPDTLSWSRTSSHDVPGTGKVRLVEEIQSDLHEVAAERRLRGPLDYRNFLTAEELAEYDAMPHDVERTPEQNRRIQELYQIASSRAPRRGYITPEEVDEARRLEDLYQKTRFWLDHATPEERSRYQEIQNRRNEIAATGYDITGAELTPEQENSLQAQLDNEQENIKRQVLQRLGWTREVERRHEDLVEFSVGVPDAPFKNPEDYATLELKKQLINAVNEDQDYLALVRGRDQIERYGMEENPNSASGMEYIYDKIYPKALRSLAKRYGAEVVEVELPVSSQSDIRPELMRESGWESVEDGVFEAVDQRDFDLLSELVNELDLYATRDIHGGIRTPWPEAEEARRVLEKAFSLESTFNDLYSSDSEKAIWALEDLERDLGIALRNLWRRYEDEVREVDPDLGVRIKTFPAIRLTPEVKERIKRIGVPLWTVGGAAALPEDEEPEGYAKGGKVWKAQGGQVESDKSELGKLRDIINTIGVTDRADRDMRRLASTALSQWTAIDPETGKITYSGLVGGTDPETGRFDAFRRAGGLPNIGALRDFVPPGIIDELIALPAFFGLGREGGASERALDRTDELLTRIQEEMEVSEAENLEDYATESLGFMLAQLPSPAGTSKGLVRLASAPFRQAGKLFRSASPRIRKAGRAAVAIPGAGVEFFSPFVEPSIANYAAGTAFGAGLRGALDLISSGEGPTPWDLALQAIEDGTLPPEIAIEVAAYLDPEGAEILREEIPELFSGLDIIEGSESGKAITKKAKGGRVRPSLMELREQVKQLLDQEIPDAGVEGTGRELVPVDPDAMLPGLPELSPESARALDSLSEGLRRGQITRREFLEGMAALTSPVSPTALLRGAESIPLPKAAAISEATAKTVPAKPWAIAPRLREIWLSVMEDSDDAFFPTAIEEARKIPGGEELAQYMEEWKHWLDEESGIDYNRPDLTREQIEEWEEILLEKGRRFEELMEELAKKHGVLVETDDAGLIFSSPTEILESNAEAREAAVRGDTGKLQEIFPDWDESDIQSIIDAAKRGELRRTPGMVLEGGVTDFRIEDLHER